MPTLVLSPRHSPDSIAVGRAAREAGWDVARQSSWRVEPPSDSEPVVYGEPLFCAAAAEALGLRLLEPRLDWLARLPERFRRRDVRAATLGDARLGGRAFVKPADDKAFRAGVWDAAELPAALDESTPVLIAEVVDFVREFRCFVLDRRVTTLSIYARGGTLAAGDGDYPATADELSAARALTEELLAEIAAPPAVVIDVGEIAGRGWAVVEANPCFGAGIYGCDPAAVLPVLARASVLAARVGPEDQPWLIR
jgi:ATP-grasp domain, R2K clade family 2